VLCVNGIFILINTCMHIRVICDTRFSSRIEI